MSSNQIKFGLPDEWQAFLKRHPVLTERLQPLFETLNKAFIRQVQTDTPAERVVFFLGRLCIEDFMEILLLCGNGYGVGGLKLLRGLYERAVTLGYITKNPQKAEEFLEYHHVHLGKLLIHASRSLPMNKYLPPDMIEQIQNSYKKAQEKYQEVKCKKCGTTRIRSSWSELDLLSMAGKAGLEGMYLECYFQPTLRLHSTVFSFIDTMKIQDNGQMTFDGGPQHEWADLALIGAHRIILYVLDMENTHFKMGLEKEIQDRSKDFMLAWDSGAGENLKL